MFKKLLSTLALVLLSGGFVLLSAQQPAQTKRYHQKMDMKAAQFISPDEGAQAGTPSIVTQQEPFQSSSTRGVDVWDVIQMGSSYNIWSVQSEGPNALSYNPELDLLLFCHRQNAGAPGGSGIISFDVSTDGGMSWDTTTKQVTPSLTTSTGVAINGNRYPNGVIFNPPGNTDPANAYFFGSGAALHTDPIYGNGWGWEFVSSSKLDGTDVQEDYYTTADTNAYLPMGAVYNPAGNGSVWHANIRRNENLDHQIYNPVQAIKFELNGGQFDRTATDLDLDWIDGVDSFAFNPRIAFSPDGQVGYTVVSGVDANDDEEFPSVKPIVWKSNDAGDTWVKQSSIPYQEQDTMIAFTIPVDADGDGSSDSLGQGSPQIPYFSQYDITVDKDGKLHIFATMLSRSDSAGSQIGFIWVGGGTQNLFHIITDGQEWESYYVDTYDNEDGTIGGGAVDQRTQAGRSPEGDFVFFTWAKSHDFNDPPSLDYLNNEPNIHAYGYSVETGNTAGPKDLSLEEGSDYGANFEPTDAFGGSFTHMMAPVIRTLNPELDFEIPLVYGDPRTRENDLDPIDYFYYAGVGFNLTEFGLVNTEQLEAPTFEMTVSPNPSRGWVQLNLPDTNPKVELTVFDFLGRVVMHQKNVQDLQWIDLSDLSNGVYTFVVKAGNQSATEKVIVSK